MSKVKDPNLATPDATQPHRVLSLHVWIKGLSPMIWRRLLVRDDSTLADLHYALQIAFLWDDSHLNHFHIHGRDYGVYHDGGIFHGASEARLSWFSFRKNEIFLVTVQPRYALADPRGLPAAGLRFLLTGRSLLTFSRRSLSEAEIGVEAGSRGRRTSWREA